jgi:phenylpropionate dioxygenase-like ring-hydroxylating dioxygenase large terminal subunit
MDMDRDQELRLIQRCLENYAAKTTTSGAQSSSDASRYLTEDRFELEMDRVIRRLPFPVAHSSEVRDQDAFKRADTQLGQAVVTRDGTGITHLFYNSCRHRGTTLVSEDSGCARRLSCPYHAWSYATDGALVTIPDEAHCFPDIDKTRLGLVEIPSVEKYGFIWACPGASDPEGTLDLHLGEMKHNLAWLQLERLTSYRSTQRTWKANWKIFAEGGLETYHFAFAHRDTIGPHFTRNLAVTDAIDSHFRVIMPTRRIEQIAELPPAERHLRDFTHTLFTLMPTDSLLTQKDHVDWIKFRPLAPGETEITITSLVPDDPREITEAREDHWQRNLDITDTVLTEDFELGEGIQRSLASGAITEIHYGRNEWALKAFNESLDRLCFKDLVD